MPARARPLKVKRATHGAHGRGDRSPAHHKSTAPTDAGNTDPAQRATTDAMAQTQHLPALLGSVGLGHLAPRLSQNEIDWETARLMKSSDLADVGMTSQEAALFRACLLYTSPSPRDTERSRMPSSA